MDETKKPQGAYANDEKNPQKNVKSQNDKQLIFSQADLTQWLLQMAHSEFE